MSIPLLLYLVQQEKRWAFALLLVLMENNLSFIDKQTPVPVPQGYFFPFIFSRLHTCSWNSSKSFAQLINTVVGRSRKKLFTPSCQNLKNKIIKKSCFFLAHPFHPWLARRPSLRPGPALGRCQRRSPRCTCRRPARCGSRWRRGRAMWFLQKKLHILIFCGKFIVLMFITPLKSSWTCQPT